MKSLETKVAPWLKGKSAYLSPHIDRAWEHQDLARMMSNEFPLPPAESVRDAIDKYGAIGNRYPDAGAIVRSYIAKLNGLDGPEYVLLGNGSNETLEMAIRASEGRAARPLPRTSERAGGRDPGPRPLRRRPGVRDTCSLVSRDR